MSERKKGATSVSLLFRLTDSTTGAAKAAIDVTTLKLQYERPGEVAGTATSLTLLAALTTAWTSYGAKEVDATNSKGVYRIDCPDAAFATGADEVSLSVTGAGIEPATRLIDLTALDSRDAVRAGLTALPNAAAGANNGLPLGDASGRVLLQPTQTGVTIPTVTTLTNLPAITTDWLTSAGVSAGAVTKIQAGLATPTNITAGTITTATNVTTVNGLAAGVITAASIAASALNGKGDWLATLGTNAPAGWINAAAFAAGAIDAAAIATDAIGSAEISAAAVTKIQSGLSTYAGGDTSGTTTLLARLTSTRAGLLDNLDAAISTRSTYAGADTAGTTTLLARLTSGRATNLDNLDATVSSRSTLTAAQVNTEADTALADVGLTTTVTGRIDAAITSRLASASYIAPDNTGIGVAAGAAASAATSATAIKVKTDQLVFTVANKVDATATIGGNVTVGGYAAGQDPATLVLDPAASGHNVAGSIGAKINAAGTAGDPWSGVAVNGKTYGQIMVGIGAVMLGNVVENAPHNTTTFRDVNDPDPGTTRVTSTNTATGRTVTLH